jgi:hypothetical protein
LKHHAGEPSQDSVLGSLHSNVWTDCATQGVMLPAVYVTGMTRL